MKPLSQHDLANVTAIACSIIEAGQGDGSSLAYHSGRSSAANVLKVARGVADAALDVYERIRAGLKEEQEAEEEMEASSPQDTVERAALRRVLMHSLEEGKRIAHKTTGVVWEMGPTVNMEPVEVRILSPVPGTAVQKFPYIELAGRLAGTERDWVIVG